jgi:uncharacterized membrane protein YuzA (DUF378 family)
MSDFTAMFVILGAFIAGSFVVHDLTKDANDRMDEILTGRVKGVQVSATHRTIMLYNQWLPTLSFAAGLSMLAAIVYARVGFLTSSEEIRFVAHLFGGMSGWGFFMYVILGSSTMLHCLSILRQAEAD